MIPRTNAAAWPRSISLRRAKELLDCRQETWVDGPKALTVTVDTSSRPQLDSQTHGGNMPSAQPLTDTEKSGVTSTYGLLSKDSKNTGQAPFQSNSAHEKDFVKDKQVSVGSCIEPEVRN